RRLFTNTMVERCASTSSSSSGWIAGQIDARGSPSGAGAAPSSRMSSTGTRTSRSSCLRSPAPTIVTGRTPPTNSAISPSRRRLGGVAAAQGDADRRLGRDPGQRHPQVALDVVVERLQRRDVEHAGTAPLAVRGDPVERPQKGGQGLARAGGGQDQGVLATGD